VLLPYSALQMRSYRRSWQAHRRHELAPSAALIVNLAPAEARAA
jgi:hypothetical protein